MCAGNSLHKSDWLKLALLVGAGTAGAGALGVGPAAGLFGGAEGVTVPVFDPLTGWTSAEGAAGYGAGSGGLLEGQSGMLAGLKSLKPGLDKTADVYAKARMAGLIGEQQQPMSQPMQPPGSGPQMGGMPNSAQIAFPEAFQQQQPQTPLSELLRRLQERGYA